MLLKIEQSLQRDSFDTIHGIFVLLLLLVYYTVFLPTAHLSCEVLAMSGLSCTYYITSYFNLHHTESNCMIAVVKFRRKLWEDCQQAITNHNTEELLTGKHGFVLGSNKFCDMVTPSIFPHVI